MEKYSRQEPKKVVYYYKTYKYCNGRAVKYLIILLAFLGIATGIDYEEDRIPNWLCLTGGICGLILGWNQGRTVVVRERCFGVIIIFLLLLPFWIWKVIGGGDVKLFMMAACYLGTGCWRVLLLSLFVTGVHSLYLLVSRKNFKERMEVFGRYCYDVVRRGRRSSYPFSGEIEEQKAGGIHISFGVLLGYVVFVFIEYIPCQYWV